MKKMKTQYTLKLKYIIVIMFLSVFVVTSQSIKKGYKSLEKQDYARALQEFKEVLSKDRSNPGAYFGLSIIYSNESKGFYDIFNAWRQATMAVDNITRLTPDDDEILKEYFLNTEVRKTSRPVNKKIQMFKDEVENKLVRFLREENNLEVVNQFLEEFKDFEHYENVIHIRNYIEYRKAENTNTLAALEEFMKKYPDAAQIDLAREKCGELAFKEAKTKNSVSALNSFIQKYPESMHIPDALVLVNRLEFEQVQRVNTFNAYQAYIEKYPNSSYIPKVHELQKKLMYEEARKINTLEAYNKFINMYPDGSQYIDIFNLKALEVGKKFNKMNTEFTGSINWTKGFDNAANDDISGDICVAPNGEIIITGRTLKDDTSVFYDAWVIKLDQNQKMLWNITIGERYNDEPKRVCVDNENNIIVAGYMNSPSDTVKGQAWVFKLNEKGKKVWNRRLDIPEILAMDVSSNNEIILGGYEPNDSLPPKYVIYKLTPQGRKFYKREYLNYGRVNDLQITDENEIILAGDKWIWKLNDRGYIEWDLFAKGTDSIVAMDVMDNGNIALLGRRNMNECLLMVVSPKGKIITEKSFQTSASVCEPVDLISTGEGMMFVVKMDSFYKLLYSDAQGNINKEFDFNRSVVTSIGGLYKAGTGNYLMLITADYLGQKKDIIISSIKN